jgi:hypothetical protein
MKNYNPAYQQVTEDGDALSNLLVYRLNDMYSLLISLLLNVLYKKGEEQACPIKQDLGSKKSFSDTAMAIAG